MQPPQSVEEIKAGLETTEKGGVRQSIRNCLTVFQRDPLLSGAIAYKHPDRPQGHHKAHWFSQRRHRPERYGHEVSASLSGRNLWAYQ